MGYTLLCVAGAWASLSRQRDLHAGAWLGVALFKPRLGLPLVCLVALSRPRILWGVALVAAPTYLVSAVFFGFDWPQTWWQEAWRFRAASLAVDAENHVDFLGWLASVGGSTRATRALGGALTVLTAVLLAALFRSPRRTWREKLAFACASIPLLAPHGLYYDAALSLWTLAAVLDARRNRGALPVLALLVLSWSQLLAPRLHASPPFAVLLLTLLVSRRTFSTEVERAGR